MLYYYRYETQLGWITLVEQNEQVCKLLFALDSCTLPWGESKQTDLLANAYYQLQEYLGGQRRVFDLPLAPQGTRFMRLVWEQLCAIPYGEKRTYSEVARAAGSPRAYRAVGMANHLNPLPIFIPCHRVIGADGSLTGYRGGLAMKELLLRLEAENTKL